nr:PREDICTED: kinetochore-associated protein NSL1 homolog isoform X2 [Latimeria chalumnae]|eukprot:XP_006009275.1 PREDICTED: kinetochore-associated protein NSL1 homolog isoform X2 [Latimeria chalumnae]
MKALEDSLDQHIVETASKRKQYPGKIVACFIKKLKAERQMLELYHPNIKPREIKADAAQGSRMTNVLAAASAVCKQTSEAMKSLPVLIEKAEGLSECLRMQPILERSKVHQEVFSAVQTKDDDKANGFVMQLEVTPTEAGAQIKRELRPRTKNSSAKSPQSRLYPLRSKRQISLTE